MNVWYNDTDTSHVRNLMQEQRRSLERIVNAADKTVKESFEAASLIQFKTEVLAQAKKDIEKIMNESHADAGTMTLTAESYDKMMAWKGEVGGRESGFSARENDGVLFSPGLAYQNNGDIFKAKEPIRLDYTDGKYTASVSYEVSAPRLPFAHPGTHLSSVMDNDQRTIKGETSLTATTKNGKYEFTPEKGWEKSKENRLTERLRASIRGEEGIDIKSFSSPDGKWEGEVTNGSAEERMMDEKAKLDSLAQDAFATEWKVSEQLQHIDFREKILDAAEVKVLNAMDNAYVHSSHNMQLTDESQARLMNLEPEERKIRLEFDDRDGDTPGAHPAAIDLTFNEDSLDESLKAHVTVTQGRDEGIDLYSDIYAEAGMEKN